MHKWKCENCAIKCVIKTAIKIEPNTCFISHSNDSKWKYLGETND